MAKSKVNDVSDELIEVLRSDFEERRKKNPSFSLRSYATKLGVSNSFVARLFLGKRKLSYETFLEMAKEAKISEKKFKLIAIRYNEAVGKNALAIPESAESFRLMASLPNAILMGIIQALKPKLDFKLLSDLSGYPVSDVKRRIELAIKTGAVAVDKNGHLAVHLSKIELPTDFSKDLEDIRNRNLLEALRFLHAFLLKMFEGKTEKDCTYISAKVIHHQKDLFQKENRKKMDRTCREFLETVATMNVKSKKRASYLSYVAVVPAWVEK